MAQRVLVKNSRTGEIKSGFIGFSWTMFFWGDFVPLFRGEILKGIILILLDFIAVGIFICMIYAFSYNRQYTNKLLTHGYEIA